jgi:hypothetical protein
LRSQIATLKLEVANAISISDWGGRRHPPYAFTEQGVALLSSVLRSKRAVQIECTAERELKSLPTNLFDRIVPRTKPLALYINIDVAQRWISS